MFEVLFVGRGIAMVLLIFDRNPVPAPNFYGIRIFFKNSWKIKRDLDQGSNKQIYMNIYIVVIFAHCKLNKKLFGLLGTCFN